MSFARSSRTDSSVDGVYRHNLSGEKFLKEILKPILERAYEPDAAVRKIVRKLRLLEYLKKIVYEY